MTCEKETLKIAIASDLHAHSGNDVKDAPSFLDISTSRSLRSQHPIEGLKQFIADENLSADLLLCPGDLTDKARPEPLDYAWNGILELGGALGVDLIAATAGNHDLDSSYAYNHYDATGMLQHVRPAFPLPDGDSDTINHYWARKYVIQSTNCYRLVLLGDVPILV